MRPQSTQYGLPLFLEDSTGSVMAPTKFSDLYDRLQLSCSPSRRSNQYTDLTIRCSSGRSTVDCILTLPPPGKSLEGAMVSYSGAASIPAESYLRKVKGLSSRSPSRRFTASDAQTYTWSFTQSNLKDASTIVWMCHNSQGSVVAEYAVNDRALTGSQCAAILTVEEAWSSIVLELLTTLILVRHISAQKL